jgi:5-methylcytosine-specific restriction protein A
MIPIVVCITCGRPALPGRSRCPAHSPKATSGWAKYSLANPREAAYYRTEHWRVQRREVLERDSACQLRLQGCTGRSSEVDHIIRPRDGGSHELSNLRGVCRRCHLQRTAEQGKQGNKRAAARRKGGDGSNVRRIH